ncbi:Gfo/Idh/MocA family protein [uncultured Pseudokineococcus sp.]|uniref:Gfo/Idh/MocA family protein n=1 Tax=uncultured Pseudokineococcus sp. TaxID=1642928 RepID=UPI00261A1BDA|nr:Gfo/Idh/MocA family oxidoreductase [uncultured Pseudokineococcus sp.]
MTDDHAAPPARRTRYAIVGLGGRAQMYVRALASTHADTSELVALCDVNQTRMDVHNAALTSEHGLPAVPTYGAADFTAMLEAERVDAVVVTTVDRTHDEYIVAAMRAGCDVVTEKPMTVDAERCRRILDAQEETGRKLVVTFNYRYNPAHAKVREVIASGAIGEVGSVHFEWLLDTRHGADYFRRWHRDKANSGGLMVHKATHHFDLVNWWIASSPDVVFGLGRLFFYGDENGARRGLARDYTSAHGAAAAADDPFAMHLESSPSLKALYLDAQHEDGYHRDQNVFAPGVTIEDDMAVAVRYRSGATMSYHLTAYSPWEGYHVAINGSEGRLELDVVENSFVDAATAGRAKGEALHGADEAEAAGGSRLTLRRLWERPVELELPDTSGAGHGGGDERMLADIFGPGGVEDPLGRASTQLDGARSLLTGLAANRSFETGRPVQVDELLAL